MPTSSTLGERLATSVETIAQLLGIAQSEITNSTTSHQSHGSLPHIFSHINMTYHTQHLIISSQIPPPDPIAPRVSWLGDEEIEHANVGTGVKKVWAAVFGTWGSLEPATSKVTKKSTKGVKKRKSEVVAVTGEKVVKKIMMPSMPTRKALAPK
jgi:A/G-specific adenine glycosylase